MTSLLAMTRFAVAAVALGLAGAPCAHAQDSTPWVQELHATARLIGGDAATDAGAKLLRAGIEVKLDPGWKTYWRDPGDSGTPPTFDFAESANVKSVSMQWPAPMRFDDGAGGHSIGYHDHVIWPLRVTPKDASKPASLHVKFHYAVCGKLCVPAEADLALSLSGKNSGEDSALAAAEARVPRHAALSPGSDAGAGLAVRSVHRELDEGRQRVVVEVATPRDVPVELFAEGPTPDWALPLPEADKSAVGAEASIQRFTFALDGLPPDAQAKGATLTLTAVTPTDAVEVKARLD
ncbi:MAG TPA: protein-disulfide reductase DsbD domain-containing protein [Xanthobacteraceae bacterium]|jgi:DsbC/DsbD-like thiol-disulfide interchange protein